MPAQLPDDVFLAFLEAAALEDQQLSLGDAIDPAKVARAGVLDLATARSCIERLVAEGLGYVPQHQPEGFYIERERVDFAISRPQRTASRRPSPIYNVQITNSTVAALSVGDGSTAAGNMSVGPSGHPHAVNSGEARLRSLRLQGRLPRLNMGWKSRQWSQPSGRVEFHIEIANIGSTTVYQPRFSRNGTALSPPLKPALLSQEVMPLAFTGTVDAGRGGLTEDLAVRYSTEFGDELEDTWKLSFDTATAGDNNNGGVSLKHTGKRWVGDAGFVGE